MSAILLSNPFVTPTPSQSAAAPPGDAQSTQAVAPTQGGAATGGSGNATSQFGSGAGYGSGSGPAALQITRRGIGDSALAQPSNATPNSVVAAQTLGDSEALKLPQSNLPEVEMPDPLPTSPFLMALREAH